MPSIPKKTAPISKEIKKRSIDALMLLYSKELSAEGIKRLEAINEIAAQNSVALDVQSETVKRLLIREIEKPYAGSNLDQVATAIYSLVNTQMDKETMNNRGTHCHQGSPFDQAKLHQRSLRDQMQDHDMTQLMPQSHGNIEVLSVVRQGNNDNSTEALREGLDIALKNKAIHHIMFPVGPGHWRGVYLTKPVKEGDQYTLELYDPYQKINDNVKERAQAIESFVLELLEQCGIKANQIKIEYPGLGTAQTDGYACGDYTCAFSHYKMQQFKADAKHYNVHFIRVLLETGNSNGKLREATRQASDPSYRSPALSPVTPPKNEASMSVPQETYPRSTLKTRLEKEVFDAATGACGNQTPLRASFEKEVASLIENRHSIFANAKLAKDKRSALTSDELAAKLQAEEFEKAGLKP